MSPHHSRHEAAIAARAQALFRQWLPLDARVQHLGVQNTPASNAAGIQLSLGAERRVAEPLAADLATLVVLERHAVDEAEAEAQAAYERASAELLSVIMLAVLAASVLQLVLWAREARFRALAEHASDLVSIVRADGTIRYASPSHQHILGYTAARMQRGKLWEFVHPEDARRVQEAFRSMRPRAGVVEVTEIRMRHAHGVWRTVEVIGNNRLADPTVRGFVLNARDITERKAFEEQLHHQAFHDPLTGLPNRALFAERLDHALARAARHGRTAAVLFLDLDRFKVVNDSLGHEAGDRVLVTVAARLKECVRGEDTVARFGGDEFAILLAELADASAAVRLAERIIATLDHPFRLGAHDIATATSIGIVRSTPAHTAADLLRDADVALYQAKAKGRGRYEVFDETMNARAHARLELEAELRLALERGEFVVYYQPKVELATGRFAGMEALVRWQSPRRGLVPPGLFIPVAEETGLIRPLAQWVFTEACRRARRWNAALPASAAVVVSVNLSARQFAQPLLVDDVARALRESGADPRHVQVEITESVAMGDAEATVETLARLKALGLQLAIDDFGTGYSSLAYLKRFPIDVLKIDRAFIRGLRPAGEDASIVSAVVSLGRALRLSVVAEGVETAEEAAHLRELGCELGQGYYFARPLAPAQADAYVQQRQQRAA
jgi:diguanylate cyclase (GGDEF)-like protein/PAS domain S-box-containing protein